MSGVASQTVLFGGSGSAVSALAVTGYHFTGWSDTKTDDHRTDINVTADATYTATFAIDTHTLCYQTADANGSIVGSSTQVVDYNGSGLAVTTSPTAGFHTAVPVATITAIMR